MSKKKSFFERLTGAVHIEEEDNEILEDVATTKEERKEVEEWVEEGVDAELSIDMYQTDSHIIIKTLIAGVRPEDIEVSITRDMVIVKGKREGERHIEDGDYFHKELYWGSFSRKILLPQEVEVDESEAVDRHGLLILKLPKIDKTRQTRIKVKVH